jgi:hypothetical protein
MTEVAGWVKRIAGEGTPVLVTYPLSFDWAWLYWYFINFCGASPFNHSRCFDLKTAYAFKAALPIAQSSRSHVKRHPYERGFDPRGWSRKNFLSRSAGAAPGLSL